MDRFYNTALHATDKVPFLIVIGVILAIAFIVSMRWLKAGERKDREMMARVKLEERAKLHTRVAPVRVDAGVVDEDISDLVPPPITSAEAFARFNHKGGLPKRVGDHYDLADGGKLEVVGTAAFGPIPVEVMMVRRV